jgi:superfamily I DNA/RNA helicase
MLVSCAESTRVMQVGNTLLADEMANKSLVKKQLRATRADEQRPIEFHEFGFAYDQAKFVVARIKELHDEGFAFRDMACLCRCHKNKLFLGAFGVLGHLKRALVRHSIPHRVYRGRACVSLPLRCV